MATPYTIDLTFITASGQQGNVHLTADDVTAHYYLDPSGSSDIILSSDRTRVIRMLYSGTPATTTTAQVYINGQNTGYVLTGAANTAAAVSPQVSPGTPLVGTIPAGAKIKFVQV